MGRFVNFLILLGLGTALGVTVAYVGSQLKKEWDEPDKIERLFDQKKILGNKTRRLP